MDEAVGFAIQPAHRAALMVLSALLFGMVLELVRREYLKERYALLWLGTAFSGLAIGMFPILIVKFAQQFHLQMITLLFAVAFLYVLGIVLSFSVIISALSERNRRLAQDVALLGNRLARLEHRRHGA